MGESVNPAHPGGQTVSETLLSIHIFLARKAPAATLTTVADSLLMVFSYGERLRDGADF